MGDNEKSGGDTREGRSPTPSVNLLQEEAEDLIDDEECCIFNFENFSSFITKLSHSKLFVTNHCNNLTLNSTK